MFKLVEPLLPDELKVLVSPSVVDIQLVDDDLANDVTFTCDDSVQKDPARPVYTYASLRDVVSPRRMEEICDLVFRVLSGLVAGVSYLCFMTGGQVSDSDADEMENRLVLRAYYETLEMNGRIVITEMARDDLSYAMRYFGNYDTMRGVALLPGGASRMYADLRLFEPLPTTDRDQRFQPPTYSALQIALRHGAFFFEEVKNGTRLRIVTTSIAQADLTRRIETIIRDQPQCT